MKKDLGIITLLFKANKSDIVKIANKGNMLESLDLILDNERVDIISKCDPKPTKELDNLLKGLFPFVNSLCVIDNNTQFIN